MGVLSSGGPTTTTVPAEIPGLKSLATVDVGWDGAGCAVTTSGTVSCWDNSGTPPSAAVGIRDVRYVTSAVFLEKTCVLLSTAGVLCWARDPATASEVYNYGNVVSFSVALEISYGVQGDGGVTMWGGVPRSADQMTYRTDPIDAVVVAGGGAGSPSACAIGRAGTVHCWGINSVGQLGDGTTMSTSPTGAVWKTTTVSGLDLW
jgi:hypothetical protein